MNKYLNYNLLLVQKKSIFFYEKTLLFIIQRILQLSDLQHNRTKKLNEFSFDFQNNKKNESRPFRLIKIPLTWSYNSRNFFIYYYAIFNSSIDLSLTLFFSHHDGTKEEKARWERKGKENYMKNFIKFINPVFVNKNNLNLTRKIKIKIYINKQNRKKVNSGRSFLLFFFILIKW